MGLEALDELSVKEQGFLIALLLFGSQETKELLAFLEATKASRFLPYVALFHNLDKTKRVSWLITKLKQLLQLDTQSRLLTVDPSWIFYVLNKEPKWMLRTVSQAIFPDLAKELSGESSKEQLLPLDLVKCLKEGVEKQLFPMVFQSLGKHLKLQHLVLLNAKDFGVLLQKLGKQTLANIFFVLGQQSVATSLRQLNSHLRNELMEAIQSIEASDPIDKEEAKHILIELFSASQDLEQLLKSAGIWMLSMALALEELAPVCHCIAQRIPVLDGIELMRKAKYHFELKNPYQEQAEKNILACVMDLSREEKIDPRFSTCVLKEI